MEPSEAPRVRATPAALELIERLKAKHGGDLLFHQSGGCCDGSAPMCLRADEFVVGDRDVKLGEIGGIPFFIGHKQAAAWAGSRLIIDAIAGNGGMFSLDNGSGTRFLTRSEACGASPGDP